MDPETEELEEILHNRPTQLSVLDNIQQRSQQIHEIHPQLALIRGSIEEHTAGRTDTVEACAILQAHYKELQCSNIQRASQIGDLRAGRDQVYNAHLHSLPEIQQLEAEDQQKNQRILELHQQLNQVRTTAANRTREIQQLENHLRGGGQGFGSETTVQNNPHPPAP